MDSKNTPAQQPRNQQEHGWNGCQVRMVGDTDLVECLQEIIRCKWALPFGDAYYCKHPSAKQYAFSSQP